MISTGALSRQLGRQTLGTSPTLRPPKGGRAPSPAPPTVRLIIELVEICLNCHERKQAITVEMILFEYSRHRESALEDSHADRGIEGHPRSCRPQWELGARFGRLASKAR